MEVYERLDDLVDLIEGARAVPLSDSCIVNRTITLELLDAVRALMPASLRDAAQILADRDDVLEDAAREAQSQVSSARDESDRIIAAAQHEAAAISAAAQADADGVRDQARSEAEQTIERARLEAERMVAGDTIRLEAERQARVISQHAEADASRVRAEADIYVDKRLAQLEDTLRAALDQVGRGRRRASASAAAPEPEPRAPQATQRSGGDFYDFAQDPEIAGDLVGGRRSRR